MHQGKYVITCKFKYAKICTKYSPRGRGTQCGMSLGDSDRVSLRARPARRPRRWRRLQEKVRACVRVRGSVPRHFPVRPGGPRHAGSGPRAPCEKAPHRQPRHPPTDPTRPAHPHGGSPPDRGGRRSPTHHRPTPAPHLPARRSQAPHFRPAGYLGSDAPGDTPSRGQDTMTSRSESWSRCKDVRLGVAVKIQGRPSRGQDARTSESRSRYKDVRVAVKLQGRSSRDQDARKSESRSRCKDVRVAVKPEIRVMVTVKMNRRLQQSLRSRQ